VIELSQHQSQSVSMNLPDHAYDFDPPPQGSRTFVWAGGIFDTGHRSYTRGVEGLIRMPYHLVLVTLHGGARQLEAVTDCGHRYCGPERAGAVSFVPANCERRVRMHEVELAWASIALRPDLFDAVVGEGESLACEIAPFSNANDSFVAALAGELVRVHDAHGRLDSAYCETMSHALASYLARRYGHAAGQHREWKLSPWRVRRIAEYVDANLGCEIAIADLARLVGVSAGHLHRAFRATLGVTPLSYIHEKRIERAIAILASEQASIAEVALRVGYVSAGHFSRTFRRLTGVHPSKFRAGTG
jgi:AraC family transcriptional regulator